MVAPQWGTFQKPNQLQRPEEEFIEELPGEISDSKRPEAEKPQWGNFQTPTTYQGEPDSTEDESWIDYMARNTTALASRGLELVGGRYGNMEKFLKDIISNFPETGGVIGKGIAEWIGPEKWEQAIRGQGQLAPTSEQLKEASYKATEGYTKPKTPGEKRLQEYESDVIGMFMGGRSPNLPGQTAGQRATQMALNKFVTPAVANVTKNIAEDIGFGENVANLAKYAVWLPMSLAFNVSAPRYASDMMNQGRNGIPPTVNMNIPRLQNRLQQVDKTLLRADPRTALARQELAEIERDLANGQTSVRSAMNTYDGINAAKRNRGLFDFSRDDRTYARNSIDKVRDVVREEIMDSAANYPQALDSWRSGIQSWAVIHQSRALMNWIQDLAKGPYAKMLAGPALGLFGVGGYAAHQQPAFALASAAATAAAYKTGQTLYRMWNDPNLKNYYFEAIGAAQRENAQAFISNYNKLNKSLEKSDSTKPKSKSKKK